MWTELHRSQDVNYSWRNSLKTWPPFINSWRQPRKSSNYSWRNSLKTSPRKTWTIAADLLKKNGHLYKQRTAAREKLELQFIWRTSSKMWPRKARTVATFNNSWLQSRKRWNYCWRFSLKTWPRLWTADYSLGKDAIWWLVICIEYLDEPVYVSAKKVVNWSLQTFVKWGWRTALSMSYYLQTACEQ